MLKNEQKIATWAIFSFSFACIAGALFLRLGILLGYWEPGDSLGSLFE